MVKDFNFDCVEYTVDAEVESSLTVDTYIIDAMYEVYQTDATEITVGAGLHMLDTQASIRAAGSVEGGASGSTEQARANLLAPLPNLRANVFHAFNDKWSLIATAGWMSANVDAYSGSFEYLHLRGQYQVTDAFGLSLGYQLAAFDITETLGNGKNSFDAQFTGVSAAISCAF